MNERKQRILNKLAEEGDKTAEFFRHIPVEQLDTEIYSDGTVWTIRAIMYHILDSEVSFNALFRNILTGGPGAPEDFDINTHNNARVGAMGDWDPAAFADSFLAARRQNIAAFANACDEDLDRVGRHPALGVTNLENMLKITFLHNRMHQKDIQQALADVVG